MSSWYQPSTVTTNPALSIIGLLPTPELRTSALLATLRTEVARRSGKERQMTIGFVRCVTKRRPPTAR